jgi:hypothetical protein
MWSSEWRFDSWSKASILILINSPIYKFKKFAWKLAIKFFDFVVILKLQLLVNLAIG